MRSYKYLGCIIEQSGSWAMHANKVIQKINFAYRKLYRVFNDYSIPIRIKLDVFSALVKALCGYAKAVWTPSRALNRRITATLNRIMRSICGCSYGCSTDVIHKCLRTFNPILYETTSRYYLNSATVIRPKAHTTICIFKLSIRGALARATANLTTTLSSVVPKTLKRRICFLT